MTSFSSAESGARMRASDRVRVVMVQTVPLSAKPVKRIFRRNPRSSGGVLDTIHVMRLYFLVIVTLAALTFGQTPAAWEEPLARREWDKAEPLLKAALAEAETAPVLRGLATVYR